MGGNHAQIISDLVRCDGSGISRSASLVNCRSLELQKPSRESYLHFPHLPSKQSALQKHKLGLFGEMGEIEQASNFGLQNALGLHLQQIGMITVVVHHKANWNQIRCSLTHDGEQATPLSKR